MTNRESIVTTARQFIGTRWHHQGRHPTQGLDCIGLLIVTAKALSIPVKDYTRYHRQPKPKELLMNFAVNLDRGELEDRRPGTVFLFWLRRDTMTQHVALWTGQRIIHAFESEKMVVEQRLKPTWERRIHSTWQFKGVSD